jgi:phage terminase large subunit-like protein
MVKWKKLQARQNQLPPDDYSWQVYLVRSGRGFGKTKMAAEWLAERAIKNPNSRWAIIAKTFADARDTCAEGESGVVNILKEYGVLKNYNRSNGEIFLTNGSRLKLFSSEEPDRLRGPQFWGGWCDEFASFNNFEVWDNYVMGARLGPFPQTLITTTPRPIKILKKLIEKDTTITVSGSTYENAANLAPSFLEEMRLSYEGTRLGRQEIYGEILEDTPGALWTREMIETSRITKADQPPLARIVVAIDPAVTSSENADETGIIVAGVSSDGHYYVIEDLSMRGSPQQWARMAVDAYQRHKANRIVGETNNGGDMIELLLRQVDPSIAYRKVTATRGKLVRAEPVAALSEQFRLHMVGGFEVLEDQMCTFTPDSDLSPDHLDAMVWAIHELMEGQSAIMGLAALAKFCMSCRMPAPKTATTCPSCHQPLGA